MLKMNLRLRQTLFFVVWLCQIATLWGQEKSTKPIVPVDELVFVRAGDLPIILSAPHGGTGEIPGVIERTGTGLATGIHRASGN